MNHVSVPFVQRSNPSSSSSLLSAISQERLQISYRPEWRSFTGSVIASILLRQIIFRWEGMDRQPFYKFKQPCDHTLYRPGDSWCEELGLTKREFEGAIKKIGFKRTAKNSNVENTTMPVEYWTDLNRVTYYTIIPEIMERLLEDLYGPNDGHISVNQESGFTKIPKGDLPVNPKRGFTSIRTKSTSKNTNDYERAEPPSPPKPKPKPEPKIENPSSSFSSHDLNDLMQAVPQEHRSSDVEKNVTKALKAGKSKESIIQAIQMTMEKATGSWSGYFAGCLADGWYETWKPDTSAEDKKAAEEKRLKDAAEAYRKEEAEKAEFKKKAEQVDALLESVDMDMLDSFIDGQDLNGLERHRFRQGKRVALRRRFVGEFVQKDIEVIRDEK